MWVQFLDATFCFGNHIFRYVLFLFSYYYYAFFLLLKFFCAMLLPFISLYMTALLTFHTVYIIYSYTTATSALPDINAQA